MSVLSQSSSHQFALYLDVSSLFLHFSAFKHPTGIHRVLVNVLEGLRAEQRLYADRPVTLVRLDLATQELRATSFEEIDTLLSRPLSSRGARTFEHALRRFAGRLPKPLREKLRSSFYKIRQFRKRRRDSIISNYIQDFQLRSSTRQMAHGAAYVNLGPFGDEYFEHCVFPLIETYPDLLVTTMIHDIIPISFPGYVDARHSAIFRRNLEAVIAKPGLLLCSSEAVRQDVFSYAESRSIEIAPEISKIRFGDHPIVQDACATVDFQHLERLGLRGPYILMVGTIEIRKNHALAVRAWEELARKHGGSMPKLVFAGRWGWKVADLRSQLEDSSYLSGLVRVLPDASDADLHELYKGARFTLMASLCEGWGLPVSESHAYGKVCVASNSSSIPEAGAGLAVLFENDCRRSLIEAVEPLLFDDDYLSRLEAKIAREFVPVAWSHTWQDIRDAVQNAM